jgi:hypothetical protein
MRRPGVRGPDRSEAGGGWPPCPFRACAWCCGRLSNGSAFCSSECEGTWHAKMMPTPGDPETSNELVCGACIVGAVISPGSAEAGRKMHNLRRQVRARAQSCAPKLTQRGGGQRCPGPFSTYPHRGFRCQHGACRNTPLPRLRDRSTGQGACLPSGRAKK